MKHGALAVFLWSFLALLRRYMPDISSMELSSVGILIGGVTLLLVGGRGSKSKIQWSQVLFHGAGLLGYHLIYLEALVLVPPLEAALINYTWPLVLGLALIFPRIKFKHVAIMVLGYLGVVSVFGVGGGSSEVRFGHVLAGLAAVEWIVYSLMIRAREKKSKGSSGLTDIALGCVVAGVVGLLLTAIRGGGEFGIVEFRGVQWLWLVVLGIGPMGLSFWFWDQAMRKKDATTTAALSNFTPVLTVFWLIVFGGAAFEPRYLLALVLVVTASVLQRKLA